MVNYDLQFASHVEDYCYSQINKATALLKAIGTQLPLEYEDGYCDQSQEHVWQNFKDFAGAMWPITLMNFIHEAARERVIELRCSVDVDRPGADEREEETWVRTRFVSMWDCVQGWDVAEGLFLPSDAYSDELKELEAAHKVTVEVFPTMGFTDEWKVRLGN